MNDETPGVKPGVQFVGLFGDVEFELDNIAVLHDVGLALGAQKSGFADGPFGAEAGEIVVADDRGGDKATLKIGMDGASGFGSGGTLFDGPGTAFFVAGGEERLEAEGLIRGLY